ncbi:acyl-CoA N-acyltransferase [Hypoxylon crocopeplum]|nr:acyl-CoA N-acyltransferase [Hypoxylon crocopeplum]
MATDSLTFRLATAEDAAKLEILINTAFRNDNTTQVFLSPDHARVEVIDVATIAAKIAQPDCAVLALTDAVTGTLIADGSVRRLEDGSAWFGMLAVDVSRQGRGLGSKVLAWAEQHARREWGARRLEFDVVCTRTDLIAWYTRRGYRATGKTTPFPYDRHGDWKGVLRDDLHFINLGKDLSDVPITAGA